MGERASLGLSVELDCTPTLNDLMVHKTAVFTLGLALRDSTSPAAFDSILRLEDEAVPHL